MTKRILMFALLLTATGCVSEELQFSSKVVHVATALDHLTVLEFGEPVTMAASGSAAFEVERHEDKVFVRPVKPGASTDLFIWTASGRRFVYELEAPGEVKTMNFAVDDRPVPKIVPIAQDSAEQMSGIADMMLMAAFLNAERIDSSNIKNDKDPIVVSIDHVFQSSNTLYIHYSIRNSGTQAYRLRDPDVYQVIAPKPQISLFSLRRTQLGKHQVQKLGKVKAVLLKVASAGTQKQEIAAGDEAQGVVAIRQQFDGPAAFELVFQGEQHVAAIFVR